ncbi:MAG: hybrid sensor histidine kinase/response regulator, partial [Desulfocapsaceae bacterium]|nr:hybrid sensor histidine kinase/response regulator [Desulfocapsaceae bacterium]
MENSFAIFNQVTTFTAEINELLALLADTDGDHLYLCLDQKGTPHTSGTTSLEPSPQVLEELSAQIQTGLDAQSFWTTSNGDYHALSLPELKATLLFSSDHVSSQGVPSLICRIVKLCLTLFRVQQEHHKTLQRLDIQKKQFDRKFSVLEQKYQTILEENQKNYQVIQEQQDNYSKTLQSEIEIQTKQL